MTARPIWIYGDLRTLRHWHDSLKVLGKALALAEKAHTEVAMVLMGDADETAEATRNLDLSSCVALEEAAGQALAHGAHSVHCMQHPLLAVPRSDVHAGVLSRLVKQRVPWLILLPLNDFGRETAAICAQNCQAGLIADCAELLMQADRFVGRCPAWGGQIMADIALADGWPTAFVTVQPHGAALPSPVPIDGGRIERITLDQVHLPEGARLVGRSMESSGKRRLEDAEVVVVGGAGLGDIRGFGLVRELAAALGAEVGATRPPVLYHWVDEERLIGQTGKTVRPKLLISVGASGAVQYTAGIMEAQTIVAVNRDPAAPIFQMADIGIAADAGVFLPLLNRRAQQAALQRLADTACAVDSEPEPAKGGFGALVARLREARNWSQAELAHATGQTPEFIEQVENEQLSPPVGFIMRMARAMQIDPGTFLKKEEQTAIRDRRAQAYYQRTQSYSYTTLTPEAASSHLRAFMITIEAHHDHKPVAYKHEGEEFIYVMEGDLGLTLGSRDHVLKPGESIHFNSDIAHKLKSLSSQPTRCLVVLYTL
ncbi:MAG: cupin domain-containing protein [Desulfobacteraceae bacterium]|nr:MAG: cupin domain-containing protein [Desulfobacteraceae bacterium]